MTHASAKQIAKALTNADAGAHCTKETILRWAKAEPHLWPFVLGPNRSQLFIVEKLKPAIRAALLASERATFEKPEPPALPAARADGPAVQHELFESTAEQRDWEEFFSAKQSVGEEHRALAARADWRVLSGLVTNHWNDFYRFKPGDGGVARAARILGCSEQTVKDAAKRLARGLSEGKNRFAILERGKTGPKVGSHSKHSYDAEILGMIQGLWETPIRHTRRFVAEKVYRRLIEKQGHVSLMVNDYGLCSPTAFEQFVTRYINEKLGGKNNPARFGAPGIKAAAGSIVRRYDDERAGDTACIDEREPDCYPYDDLDHRIVYNYGPSQPILHFVSLIDQRTTRILAWALTIDVDHETPDLMESYLRNNWKPLRLVSDHASRFQQFCHGRVITRRTEELAKLLDGPLGTLGVLPITAREKNPRANRIERVHLELSRREQQHFGLSWRPPKDHREATGIDESVQIGHFRKHCREGLPSPLMPLSQVVKLYAGFVDEINNMETDAKGCNGLTRAAAFKYFQPAADEIARRKVPEAVIDNLFAENFERVVRPGCQLWASDARVYTSLALAPYIGQKLEFRRFRRDRSKIFVKINGLEVECFEQPHVGTNDPETLAKECERLAHNRKELSRENPPAPAPAPAPEPGYPEISSTAFMMEKIERTHAARKASAAPVLQPTSDDVARAMWEAENA